MKIMRTKIMRCFGFMRAHKPMPKVGCFSASCGSAELHHQVRQGFCSGSNMNGGAVVVSTTEQVPNTASRCKPFKK
jgi:hypothetical protein